MTKKIYFFLSYWLIISCFTAIAGEETDYEARNIQYSFTLQNMSGRVLEKAVFYTYIPVAEKAFQKLGTIEASPPSEIKEDGIHNRVMIFKFIDLPPFAAKIVNINVSLQMTHGNKVEEAEDLSVYLKPQEKIESDNAQIISQALVSKKETLLETVQNIFKWTSRHIRYSGYVRESRGALYALNKKEGDCTEYMALFVALCRANGIPARGLGGYRCEKDCILKPSEYHNWAEFYLDGSWHLADPQNKVFMQDESKYLTMQIVEDNPHSIMKGYSRYRFEGEGLQVRMN